MDNEHTAWDIRSLPAGSEFPDGYDPMEELLQKMRETDAEQIAKGEVQLPPAEWLREEFQRKLAEHLEGIEKTLSIPEDHPRVPEYEKQTGQSLAQMKQLASAMKELTVWMRDHCLR